MIEGAAIASAALAYVGTPFVHQGRKLHAGIDCAGLIICAANDAGVPITECTAYGRQPEPSRFLGELRAQLDTAEPVLLPGVALHFAFAGWPMHLGIALDATRFVHAYCGRGVIVSTFGSAWARRMRGAWRYRGVRYG